MESCGHGSGAVLQVSGSPVADELVAELPLVVVELPDSWEQAIAMSDVHAAACSHAAIFKRFRGANLPPSRSMRRIPERA